jgi:hypothetical protein
VENLSYIICPDCGKKINMFGGQDKSFYETLGIKLLGEMPMSADVADVTASGITARNETVKYALSGVADAVIEAVK